MGVRKVLAEQVQSAQTFRAHEVGIIDGGQEQFCGAHMGLLEVTGSIDAGQFWPQGESDADTTKVIVQTGPNAFRFQPHPGAPFAVTHVFEGAKVIGATTKAPLDGKGRITIRLQGIDAPELHYSPARPGRAGGITESQRKKFNRYNKRYRQHFGESATVALFCLLSRGRGSLQCRVTTLVEHPNDVFDTYGRFIGDILVRIHGGSQNANVWLVEQGWAFPAFYSTMTFTEINTFIAAAKMGRTRGRIWKNLHRKISPFDPSLQYRRAGAQPNPATDVGPVNFPKLFRRQCTWWVYKRSGITTKNFRRYLASKPDPLFLTKDFLANGVHSSTQQFLHEYVDADGNFSLRPEQMVFKEKPSTLVDANGKKITSW